MIATSARYPRSAPSDSDSALPLHGPARGAATRLGIPEVRQGRPAQVFIGRHRFKVARDRLRFDGRPTMIYARTRDAEVEVFPGLTGVALLVGSIGVANTVVATLEGGVAISSGRDLSNRIARIPLRLRVMPTVYC